MHYIIILAIVVLLSACNTDNKSVQQQANQAPNSVKMQTTTPCPCTSTTPTPSPTPAPAPLSTTDTAKSEAVINAGMKYLGTPYQYGSDRATKTTMDCSEFVRWAFLDGINLKLPTDSRAQADYVRSVGKPIQTNWRNLKRGDIMFFMSYYGLSQSNYSGINKTTARITHDGIYLGDGKMLHTYSKESGGVRIDSIAGRHWEYRFLFGGSAF